VIVFVDEKRMIGEGEAQKRGTKQGDSAILPCECGSCHKTTLVLKGDSVCRPAPRVAVAQISMIRVDATASRVENPPSTVLLPGHYFCSHYY
jgi:hypothetical protein